MIIKCYNENHPYLLFMDIEFNNRDLVQFSGLLFKRIDFDGGYQLMRSCNQYVAATVCYPFVEYTSLTNNFLAQNGVPLRDVEAFIMEDFLGDIKLTDMLVIAHGLRNDRLVLQENGINLSNTDNNIPIDGYCTFNNAKRILNRSKNLTLHELATEAGYYLHNAHNAYNDTWAEVSVFTYLKKREVEQQLCKTNS